MAQFAVNQPITTREATIVVDAGLPPGTHRFQLTVVTADGRQARSAPVDVVIVERGAPLPSA